MMNEPVARDDQHATPVTPDVMPERPVNGAVPEKRKRRPVAWLTRDSLITAVLLIAIMAFGGYLRFVGQNWDDFTDLHPDERFLTGVAAEIGAVGLQIGSTPGDSPTHMQDCVQRYPATNGVGGYFDSECSNLYPPNIGHGTYVYGELPLFIVHYAAKLVAQATGDPTWAAYDRIHFVGRSVSAIADIFTIFFIFLIGRRLYGRWTGLLAALLYSVAVLPIQLSHFWTMDAVTNLPLSIAIYCAVRVLDRSRWQDYLGFGAALGAAIACRINVAPLAGLIVLAAIIYSMPLFDVTIPWSERGRIFSRAIIGLLIAGAATLIVFRVTNPHAFTGPSIFGIVPYRDFLYQLSQAQYFTSGHYDGPPNYQWIDRAPYLFAWRNIVEWGMGIPLGLVAWGAWIWAMVQVIRARKLWTRHALLVAWIFVYFAYFGRNWVATMRYFMPMYPALILLGAWMLVEMVKRGRSWTITHPASVRRVGLVAASAVLIFVTGFSILWGNGFAQIHARLLTRVEASQWFARNVPASVSATISTADGKSWLLNMPYGGVAPIDATTPLILQQTSEAGGTFSTLNITHALSSGQGGTLHAKVFDSITNQPLAQGQVRADFTQINSSPLGNPYTITLDKPVTLSAAQQINIQLYADDSPVQLTGTSVGVEGGWDDAVPYKVCPLPASIELTDNTPSGLRDYSNCNGLEPFNAGYYTVPSNDGLYMAADDTPAKIKYMQDGLDKSDYLTISSNRFYDSEPRDPARFPMTTNYYRALFAGQLGYDVVKVFTSYINIGPFSIPDEALPTYNWPSFMKEWWQSEEAFTVYDHPAVYVLKKNAQYNSKAVAAVLNGTNITDVTAITPGSYDSTTLANKISWPTYTANAAPSGFMMSPELASIQQSGGTWSDLFNLNSLVNSSPVATVLIWYLTLMLLGLIAWPLLFAILPGLPDRGYPLSKIAGLLLVAWFVWTGGTLRFLTWSAPGIAFAMLLLAAFSTYFAVRRRAELLTYMRSHWRHMLIVEGITLALFIGFLLVRLGNPDLWAQTLGGEKPMDFAYFNAVLRSTVFPPYDPWYSGGFMNYYYFGFVLVATPVKLLGVVPAVAYNLILPMLYAFTGIGAFSIAYNVVASRLVMPRDEGDSDPAAPFIARRRWALRAPAGSPYVAGIAAMALCVIVGNLDTPRVLLTGIASAGGYSAPVNDPYAAAVNQFVTKNGRAPSPEENNELLKQSQNASPLSGITANLSDFGRWVSSVGRGLSSSLSQGYLPVGPDRWFWGPRSVIGEIPNASSEITEFPAFTYVFADMHAHMMDMPLEMLAIGWLLAEILGAGVIKRTLFSVIVSTVIGGITIGLMYATNTWDWPVYMVLAILGLTFAAYLRFGQGIRHVTRRPLLGWLAQIGLFFAVQQIATIPFRTYFATAYSSVDPFLGQKTPIWAYLDIHGVFIFLLLSLLIWQTARVLRRTYVRDVLRNAGAALLIAGAIGVTLAITFVFAVPSVQAWIFNPPYPVAIICLPMLVWAAILFFLPNQSREMRAVLAITILAIALTFATEMVTLQNDSGRQNTIFKLYTQAWLLFAIAGGVALAWLVRASERWHVSLRSPWLAVMAVLLSIAGLFPIMATQGKIAMRMAPQAPHTLDGMEYMKSAVYGYGTTPIPLIDDYKMIRWLQDNISGSPVILEAQEPEYRLGSRITMYTGLPTVLGWRFHQSQQRSLDPLPTFIWGRVGNVAAMYNTLDIQTAQQLLSFYNVQYIIVGGLERTDYSPAGLAKFDQMVTQHLLDVVYSDNGTRVYHVLPANRLNMAQVSNTQ